MVETGILGLLDMQQHENAKIPRHASQNPIAEGDFRWILTRNCEGTEQLRKMIKRQL